MTAQPASGGTPPAARPLDIGSHLAWLRTRLAMERTLMAWNRTSVSLIGFGFTIYQFFQKFQDATVGKDAARPQAPLNLGLSLVLAGTLGTLIAIWQYMTIVRYLGGPDFQAIGHREGLPRWPLPFFITIFLAFIGVITALWIVLHG